MHIVVAVKQVLDPDGVNSYALWGRLAVDESGRGFTAGSAIPLIINAYDEQAMEAALRIRDSGAECRITAVAIGAESTGDVLKRCLAMGADEAVQVLDPETAQADGFRTAALLAAVARRLGDVDVVFCGRQGSDYDQGTVPGVLAELLGAAFVPLAAAAEVSAGGLQVARVTPAGLETVEASLPAVVSVSNELGLPRYPTSRGMLEARRKRPTVFQAADLLDGSVANGVEVVRVFVPDVQGHCEIIEGATPADKAGRLLERLVEVGVLNGR